MKIDMRKTLYSLTTSMILFAVFLGISPGSALGQNEAAAVRDKSVSDYHLGAGDLVRVVVWKNDSLSGEYRVRPDGKFSMPLIGDILASGNTADSISMQVEQKLKLFIESPYVSTILEEAASNRVFIIGEVANPGTYIINGSLSALQALALAGGFTEFAIRDKMVLVRGAGENQENIPLSYRDILKSPGEETNPTLQRGDTLVVP